MQGLKSTSPIGSSDLQGVAVSEVMKEFTGTEGVEDVLYEASFDRRTGPTFQVLIFESEREAEEWDAPRIGVRIRKGNVIAEVWSKHEAAVRRALDGLAAGTKAFTADEVAESLTDHGFAVSQRLPPAAPDLEEAFPKAAPSGVRNVVIARQQVAHSTPSGFVPKLVLAALIFDSQSKASCGGSNAIGTCLRRWNVAVVVRTDWADAARDALADLD
jgi:hypothetical protein